MMLSTACVFSDEDPCIYRSQCNDVILSGVELNAEIDCRWGYLYFELGPDFLPEVSTTTLYTM